MKRFLKTLSIILLLILLVSFFSYSPLLSKNKPLTFFETKGPYGGAINSISISPNFKSDGKVVVGTSNGVYFSSDKGKTFKWITKGITNTSISTVSISPNYSRDFAVFVGSSDGLFRSDDGGSTFNFATKGLGGNIINTIACSPAIKDDKTLFASLYEAGIYKSEDLGRSWKNVGSSLKFENILSIGVSSNFIVDKIVMAGTDGNGVFISKDGGLNFTKIGSLNYLSAVNSISFSPNFSLDSTLLVGFSGGGLFISKDKGETFKNVLKEPINAVAFSPNYANDKTVFALSPFALFKSTDNGETFSKLNFPDYGSRNTLLSLIVSSNFAEDKTIFVGTEKFGLFTSEDKGETFKEANAGIFASKIFWLEMSPNFYEDKTVFFATYYQGIAKTEDGGATVSFINNGITNYNSTSLSVSSTYKNDRTVYLGTDGGGLFITTNSGTSWSSIETFKNNTITATAISNSYNEDGTAFACVEGKGFYKTKDFGKTFYKAGIGIKEIVIDYIALSPDFSNDKTMFIGTHSGRLYVSYDKGETAEVILNNGLPVNAITSIVLSPDFKNDGTIFVSAAGAGLWRSKDRGKTFIEISRDFIGKGYWSNQVAVSSNFKNDQTILSVSWQQGIMISKTQGSTWYQDIGNLYFFDGRYYYCGTIGISKEYYRDGIMYIGLNNGGVYTTYKYSEQKPPGKAPNAPTLIAPFNNETLDTLTPALVFKESQDAVEYNIQISLSASFDTTVLDTKTKSTFYSVPSGILSKGNTYYWKIRAINQYGTSNWSDTFKFTIKKDEALKTIIKLQISSTTIYVNDNPQKIDAEPIIQEGRTLVPIRAIVEALSGSIAWDGTLRKVTITLGSTTLELWIGESIAKINGVKTPIDPNNPKVVPIIYKGRTYLPLRFVAESLGALVEWDGATKTITITYPKP